MRLRLLLAFALIILITLGVVAYSMRQSAVREVRAYMGRGGPNGVEAVAAALEAHYAANETWQGAEDILQPHGMGQGAGRGFGMGGNQQAQGGPTLRLSDADGNVVFSASNAAGDNSTLDTDELEQGIPLQVEGQTVGYLLPPAGALFPLQNPETVLLERLQRASLNAALIAGGLALVLALALAYVLMRPVRRLKQAAARLAQGELSQRVSVGGKDELSALGEAFNHMAASLERAQESRQGMTADIAHELRTPLAVQRANLEALQDGVYPLTAENLAPIEEQNLLLTRLVEDLRTLALADAGELSLDFRITDLAALARRQAARFRPQAAKRRVTIRTQMPQTCLPISADPGRLEQIVNNLLQNALRHTPEGGRVTLRLSCDPQGAKLDVYDTGPGIPEAALPHVFERFYRADKARSREEGGSGLGLAIARQLALAHGGELKAENRPEGGAMFTLSLPSSAGTG